MISIQGDEGKVWEFRELLLPSVTAKLAMMPEPCGHLMETPGLLTSMVPQPLEMFPYHAPPRIRFPQPSASSQPVSAPKTLPSLSLVPKCWTHSCTLWHNELNNSEEK